MKKKTTLGWVTEFAGMHRKSYIVSVVLAVFEVACKLIPYFIMGTIVANLLQGNRDFSLYRKLCMFMMLGWTAGVILHNLSTGLSHKATFHVLSTIRRMACDKLYKLPLGYVLDTPSGELKNIMVERTDSIETTLAHIIPEFTANLFGPLCVLIYMFTLDWRMALMSLATIPIGVGSYAIMMKGYEENYKRTVDKTKALNDTAVEYINGIEVIKAFGKAESSYEKFVTAAKEGAACFVDWMRECMVPSCTAMTFFPATLIGILPLGGMLYRNGSLSASTFILIIILSFGIIAPIMNCVAYMDDIAKARTIIGEVSSILEQEEMKRPETLAKEIKGSDVTIKDVRFGYKEKEVIHGINLEMKKGTVNALVGPSGGGKSTIAKLVAGLWEPSVGEIFIGEVNARELPIDVQNRLIAYVSQDNYLFDVSVRDNLRMGNPDASDSEIEEAARKSGCHEFIKELENGYDTIVGGSGGHLSGGERQRISIARAMLKDAPIVILDEATAYTDPESEAVVQAAVAKLVKNKTLIVIAHRLTTVVDADRIFVVEDGYISARGNHEELLRESELYRHMWEAHISVKDKVKEDRRND